MSTPDHFGLPPQSAARHLQLLSRNQIEAEYGISRRWLEDAAWRGDGPPMIKLSRRCVRYRRADLDAWLEAQRHDPSRATA